MTNAVCGGRTQLYRDHENRGARRNQGMEHFDKVINATSRPIWRTPRSNPATTHGMFTPIRELMAEMKWQRERGRPGPLQLQHAGAAARPAQGDGVKKLEMHFYSRRVLPCGRRHGSDTTARRLEVAVQGKTSRKCSI